MSEAVHVVALAARTPVGLRAETTAAALRARISRLRIHPTLTDARGAPVRLASDARLDPELRGAARIAALAQAALGELLDKLSAHTALARAADLTLALPEPRPGFAPDAVDALLGGLAHPALRTCRARMEGHAGMLAAIAQAAQAIRGGESTLCVVGGADSYLEDATLAFFDESRQLACEGRRGGFIPGEGAAFLALASETQAHALGLPSLARVVGTGLTQEARAGDSDSGPLGEALAGALREACAPLEGKLPTDLHGDLNGERLRTDDWALAALRASQLLGDATLGTSSVGECGDLGAASGGVACVRAVESFVRGHARGKLALVHASSWRGLRAACVLAASPTPTYSNLRWS